MGSPSSKWKDSASAAIIFGGGGGAGISHAVSLVARQVQRQRGCGWRASPSLFPRWNCRQHFSVLHVTQTHLVRSKIWNVEPSSVIGRNHHRQRTLIDKDERFTAPAGISLRNPQDGKPRRFARIQRALPIPCNVLRPQSTSQKARPVQRCTPILAS